MQKRKDFVELSQKKFAEYSNSNTDKLQRLIKLGNKIHNVAAVNMQLQPITLRGLLSLPIVHMSLLGKD